MRFRFRNCAAGVTLFAVLVIRVGLTALENEGNKYNTSASHPAEVQLGQVGTRSEPRPHTVVTEMIPVEQPMRI
jgi:hypothetical protein